MDILSVAEMYRADELAMESGTSGIQLMDAAGHAVADAVMARWPVMPIFILCGPGNNGGDGFVAARYLEESGWPAQVCLLGSMENYTGDAAHHVKLWNNMTTTKPVSLTDINVVSDCLIVDALFGAGLTRSIEGDLADLFQRMGEAGCPVVAVDLPSGVSGDSGDVLGCALNAEVTVTFFRKKYAHVLYPGAGFMGDVVVADIGIPNVVLETIKPSVRENSPEIWRQRYPMPDNQGHKYTRGHALIVGGEKMTGAARLAARAARRMGAGLSSIATSPPAFPVYATGDPGTMVEIYENSDGFQVLLEDERKNAVLVGPGAGVSSTTRDLVTTAMASKKSIVLDADGLTVFQDDPSALFAAIKSPCVLTPHEGEFRRLFSHRGNKISRARAAAHESGAVVLLKGPDTAIAAPDGSIIINTNAVPDLATAGAGDVLAGIIVGLMAQGMPTFEAAAAGAWVHGEASARIGAGLIAEDLCEHLPDVINDIRVI
jgi:ADP-dependent NAD(P)H-hydrate dehydratase / NAD(P)H-hydrate epimerase